jgi:hypothetical protein
LCVSEGSGLNDMTMTSKGLKALGKAVRQQSPIDLRLPVEMQVALLHLAVGERAEPRPATQSLSAAQDQEEMTERVDERVDEDGRQAPEARLAG